MLNPNTTVVRRLNALSLFQEFAEQRISAGAAPKGLEQEFAQKLKISASLWSMVKTSRPIGNKLARQIEDHCGRPAGWLDEEREPQGLTSAKQHVMALALKAYRGTNAVGRKTLIKLLKGYH